jgi:hypothetical protein
MYGIYGTQEHGEQLAAVADTDQQAMTALGLVEAQGWTQLEVRAEIEAAGDPAEIFAPGRAAGQREVDHDVEPELGS